MSELSPEDIDIIAWDDELRKSIGQSSDLENIRTEEDTVSRELASRLQNQFHRLGADKAHSVFHSFPTNYGRILAAIIPIHDPEQLQMQLYRIVINEIVNNYQNKGQKYSLSDYLISLENLRSKLQEADIIYPVERTQLLQPEGTPPLIKRRANDGGFYVSESQNYEFDEAPKSYNFDKPSDEHFWFRVHTEKVLRILTNFDSETTEEKAWIPDIE